MPAMPTRTFPPDHDDEDAGERYGDEGHDHLELIVPLDWTDGVIDDEPDDDASLEVLLTERGTEWDDDESAPGPASVANEAERISRFFAEVASGNDAPARLLDDLDADGTPRFQVAWASLPVRTRRNQAEAIVRATSEHPELRLWPILRVLSADADDSVRQFAVRGLAGENEAVSLLVALVETDLSTDVRASAAEALAPFAAMAAGGDDIGLEADDLRDLLETIAVDETEPRQLRLRALESVAVFGSAGAEGFSSDIADAISEAYNDDDSGARAAALIAMGRTLNRQWLPVVQRDLTDEDAEVRLAAVTAAGAIGEITLVEEVATLADDEDDDVRWAAVSALGQIGGAGAVRMLRGLAGQPRDDRDLIDEALQEATLAVDPL